MRHNFNLKILVLIFALISLCLVTHSAFALDLELDEDNNEAVRLGIMKFVSQTYDVPDAKAAVIGDFFGRMLFKADGIKLVERERLDESVKELKLGMYGLTDVKSAAQAGKLAGCEYILLGSITNLERGAGGAFLPGIGLFGGGMSATQKVKTNIDIRVIDVETGEIVFAEGADGVASKSDSVVSIFGVGVTNSDFNGIENQAIVNAVKKLAPGIQKALTGKDTLTEKLKAEEKKNKKSAKSSTKNSKESKSKTKKSSSKKTSNKTED